MEIRKIHIDKINPAPYNPRVDLKPGDLEYERLRRSIEEFGYIELLVWNENTGNLVGGHQRFKILKAKGIQEVEVSVVRLDKSKEKALNIALNKISGDWDYPALGKLLSELSGADNIDVELTGFSFDEMGDLFEELQIEGLAIDDEPKEDEFNVAAAINEIEEPVCKRGDIWILGSHRLMCGDSTNKKDVLNLMNGKIADMVFTDPPYNVNYTGATEDALTIENDNMDDEEFYEFLCAAYSNMLDVSREGAAIYICHADGEGVNFRKGLEESGWLLKQCIIWVKNHFVMGRQDYHWQHEPILYGWKPGAAHTWNSDRKQTTVWEYDKPQRNGEHPTMKPVGIPSRGIQNSSHKGNIVFEPFGGSGSTLIAAEQLQRICYIMEYDPKYCDVIIKRWEELTGKKAIKEE
ncbi:site-specific DNA-methyltransferase [Bacillus thuringiensis]|uniref:DNA modification methylase n=2 Tax=root TaxID=1 RepID=A0A4P8MXU8_9CAUD|nr:site-specific DNA-methyltransferase [Bacillus thuringiensis]YP_009845504.1 DNA methyltransferase [Bacillus phage vB_BtS_B83]MEB9095236.1 site-specific DNA-methyltransferase [Bacillus cereus]AQY42404.1 DNA modification methylase [Bacillus thuringiensis]MDR4148519.1 DNA modification methylase [Bacillus thuringiensis]MEC3575095.1 site-specific DNA-methyltransferase [Bacillus thuringiensis]MED2019888.1 site-specific DNA-methyltransferase [Bacillus thuringiensis]